MDTYNSLHYIRFAEAFVQRVISIMGYISEVGSIKGLKHWVIQLAKSWLGNEHPYPVPKSAMQPTKLYLFFWQYQVAKHVILFTTNTRPLVIVWWKIVSAIQIFSNNCCFAV